MAQKKFSEPVHLQNSAVENQCLIGEVIVLQNAHSSSTISVQTSCWQVLAAVEVGKVSPSSCAWAIPCCMAPLDTLLDICICSSALQSILSPESEGKLAQGGQQQLLVAEAQAGVPPPAPARKHVPPSRGTEQPSGSSNDLAVLAGPQCSSVRTQSSDEVVPLSLLRAATLAPTSSPT